MRKNPDKYVRKAYLAALTDQGLTAFNKTIPVDLNPVPEVYVLIESQSKQPTEQSKDDFEWNSKVILHIVNVNPRGYTATSLVDDAEEKCINAVQNGILVDSFYVKSADMIESQNLDMTDKTNTIERRVLIYEHWLAEITTT